jgi:hypothetical protein
MRRRRDNETRFSWIIVVRPLEFGHDHNGHISRNPFFEQVYPKVTSRKQIPWFFTYIFA